MLLIIITSRNSELSIYCSYIASIKYLHMHGKYRALAIAFTTYLDKCNYSYTSHLRILLSLLLYKIKQPANSGKLAS